MNQALHAVLAWITANWTWLGPLVLLIVNDLKNGLSKYPAAETWLGLLSDLLSVHQKSDSPGTFKLPLMRSTPPTGISSGLGGPPKLAALLLATGALSLPGGCAAFDGIVQKTITCASPQVRAEVPNIIGDVINLLNCDCWNATLNDLASKVGTEVVACAVQAVIVQLESGSVTMKGKGLAAFPTQANALAIGRGNSWLAVHVKN